ncbi:cyclin-dependent kinase 11B-like [Aedes albopictus]|uniref:PHD-type domain-containing protein n=1 Tax=Aedes albopictus TaxID=7160 RepID=A0ABM1XK69_AEDAL
MVKSGNFTLTPCGVCSETSDTNEGMVGCDACDLWFHFRCVEVTEESLVGLEKWFCPAEPCQRAREETTKKRTDRKKGTKSKESRSLAPDESDRSSVKSDRQSGSTLEKRLKALEKEQEEKEQEMEIGRILREKRIEMNRILNEKQLRIDNELREKERRLEEDMLGQSLRDEKIHADRMQQMRESYQKAIIGVKGMSTTTVGAEPKFENAEEMFNAGEGCSSRHKKMLNTPLRNPGISLQSGPQKQRKSVEKKQRIEELGGRSEEELGSIDESSDSDSSETNNSSGTSSEEEKEQSHCESEKSASSEDGQHRKKRKQ